MDSQIFMIFEGGQNSIRNTSDPHLKRGSIFDQSGAPAADLQFGVGQFRRVVNSEGVVDGDCQVDLRSEEHTSELQSRGHLVCRLLLEKKNRRRETRTAETDWHITAAEIGELAPPSADLQDIEKSREHGEGLKKDTRDQLRKQHTQYSE